MNGIQKEGGPYEMANRRSVWSITPRPFTGAHFATFPQELPELRIKAGGKQNDAILAPFMSAGTTAFAAKALNSHYMGFELNPKYIRIAKARLLKQNNT